MCNGYGVGPIRTTYVISFTASFHLPHDLPITKLLPETMDLSTDLSCAFDMVDQQAT